jgi:hypothetical protein
MGILFTPLNGKKDEGSNMQRLEKTLLTLAVLLVATGCQLRRSEQSIVDNPTCSPPCWQNITPGVTTRQEFIDLITKYQYFQQESLHDYDSSWQSFDDLIRGRIQFGPQAITNFDAFVLNEEIVDLSFHGSWNITLDQAINNLGKPTSIVVIAYGNDIFVEMLIPKKGIAFGYTSIGQPAWWQSRIEPDIKISSIDFYTPDAYEKILDAGLFSYGILDGNETLNRMQIWKGYGNLSQYQK